MAGWPTASERRELGAYPAQAGPEDVKGFFDLSPDDLKFVLSHHRDAQLGVAVALCSLRWLGFVPDDLGELPRPALLAQCEQLEADPDDVIVYGTRSQTRSDHFLTVRDHAGFRAFDDVQRARLEEWLISRAMEHERPKALHALACEHLRSIKVVRPGVDVLVRMIGAARDRAHAATFDALSDQFTPDRVAGLDRLLLLREPGGVTWLEWLRTPAADGSARPIVGQIEKLRELQALEADLVELSMLPPGRVRILASEARRRSAWELSRLPPARRYPVLLVFIAEMIVERGDELIDLYCKAILNAERHARQHVKDQREKTARARDERSLLAGTLARILLDAADGGEDPLARALREVGAQRLRAAVEDPGALARPIEEQRRDALGNRHAHLAQFAPAILAALDLRAARGYQPLLDAINHVNANRSLRVLPDARLGVLPAAWRAWTLDEHDRPLRTRYELALWLLARDALRSRGLYRARSHRYGDPLGWMMPQAQWQREREGLAVIFDRPLDPTTRLHELQTTQESLVRRLQHGFERGERVLFDGEKITGERPSEQRVAKCELARVVHGMLPHVELAALLVEVNRETGFLDELSHAGASRARSPHRPQQVLGALVAAATGIGYAKMSQASSFSERELRSASERHLVDEHLDAGSARILRHLRLLPHTAIFDNVLTSSDGQRYETIGKSSIAAFAAREVGYRKRMITWLLWLTGQYGHFGSKVIPVTEPEAWHTLDALMHLDTPTVQHTTDTHGGNELVFALFDLLGWEFFPRLGDLTHRRLYQLGDGQPLLAADGLFTGRIRIELILEQWDELLRLAASLKRGWIVPSVLLARMSTDQRPDRTAKALREYGRLIESNFVLRWAGDPDMRQRSHGQLNKGESANSLRREVGYGNRGRVRAQDPEQLHRHMEARRLVANAIGYWNARYIALSFKALERTGWTLPDHDVRRVHYMHHEHINFIGRHTVDMRHGPPKGKHRPLRLPAPQATPTKTTTTNETATNG